MYGEKVRCLWKHSSGLSTDMRLFWDILIPFHGNSPTVLYCVRSKSADCTLCFMCIDFPFSVLCSTVASQDEHSLTELGSSSNSTSCTFLYARVHLSLIPKAPKTPFLTARAPRAAWNYSKTNLESTWDPARGAEELHICTQRNIYRPFQQLE